MPRPVDFSSSLLRCREIRDQNNRRNGRKIWFFLNDQLLQLCIYASLQRNNYSFQAAEHPYFAANTNWPADTPAAAIRGIAMFTHVVRLIRAWKRYHKSLSELNRLGDRELADIGISRSDIPRVAWNASHNF